MFKKYDFSGLDETNSYIKFVISNNNKSNFFVGLFLGFILGMSLLDKDKDIFSLIIVILLFLTGIVSLFCLLAGRLLTKKENKMLAVIVMCSISFLFGAYLFLFGKDNFVRYYLPQENTYCFFSYIVYFLIIFLWLIGYLMIGPLLKRIKNKKDMYKSLDKLNLKKLIWSLVPISLIISRLFSYNLKYSENKYLISGIFDMLGGVFFLVGSGLMILNILIAKKFFTSEEEKF